MSRTCSRDGCGKPARSRGMCAGHYSVWLRGYTGPRMAYDAEERLLKAMPGCYAKLADKAGTSEDTARGIVHRLHLDVKCHIGAWLAPQDLPGSRWVAVFHRGPGKDAVVTPEQKREHANARKRQRHHLNKGKPKRRMALPAAFFKPNHNNQETRGTI